MKDSEKIDAMMVVPAPMLGDAVSEYLICELIPSLDSDNEEIKAVKKHWENMIEECFKGTMKDHIMIFQFETKEQLDAVTKEMEKDKRSYIAFTPIQFNYIVNYLSEHKPDDVEYCEWQKTEE